MSAMKKIIIKVASQEQQENVKNTRKTLKDLQQTATDKENLVGRIIDKDAKSFLATDKLESKPRKIIAHKACQTIPIISAEDLMSDKPSEDYWKRLAEKRGEALNESLQENAHLKETIEALKEENKICKEMLEESKNLVEVLQEMLEEADTTTEIAEEATEQ